MNDQIDSQLLRAYVESHSEAAFAEMVRRHVDFVYSAALRMVCNSDLAQDVTQCVFIALAKNAAQLTDHPVLSGWLHRTAQHIAAQTVRTNKRRDVREQKAAAMNELLTSGTDSTWEDIAPELDAALSELSNADRDALLLRYFERKSAPQMATILGTSEDAAQKRVSRAVERLREFLAKRGVTAGASGLVVVISANAVQAAPVGLAVTISTAAALAGTTIATTTATAVTKAIVMTTLQKTLITATIVAAVGAGIYEARQTSSLRTEIKTLRQQQAPLANQIQQLIRDRDDAMQQVASLREGNERLKRNTTEIPKLRGDSARLRQTQQELAQLRANPNAAASLADLMGRMLDDPEQKASRLEEEKMTIKRSHAALFKQLNLTPDQQQKLVNIMAEKEVFGVNLGMALLTGGSSPSPELQNEITTAQKKFDDDMEALLGLDGFKQFNDFERTLPDRASLDEFKQQVKKKPLTAEQEKQLIEAMIEERAKTSSSTLTEMAKSKVDFAAEKQILDLQELINQQVLARAAEFLGPEQLAALTKYQTKKLTSDKNDFKMFQRLFNGSPK
ncbi:MAG: polymerase, sigma-24 subunit, subfamily [Verrucomicrobiales bacterium]|nr:polymerase, sigma-24 subunit, subfamily [Verrucomicrobiales bacterium]